MRIGGSGCALQPRRRGGSDGRRREQRGLGLVGTTRGSGEGCPIHWRVGERELSKTWF